MPATETLPAAATLAIDTIDATQVSPRIWTYYAEETNETYRLTLSDLTALGEMLLNGTKDAYSHWCAGYGSYLRDGR